MSSARFFAELRIPDETPGGMSPGQSWLVAATITLLAGLAGWFINSLPIHTLSGVWAGRFITLPVAIFLGPWAGAVSGAIGSAAASQTSVGLVLVFVLEAVVFGLLSRRSQSPVVGTLGVAGLFTATLVLWPRWYALPIEFGTSALPLALQRLVNLMVAPVLADFVSSLLLAAWPSLANDDRHPAQLRNRVFHAFVLVAVLPVLLVSTTSGSLFSDQQRAEAGARLNDATMSLADRLSAYIDTHLQATASLALVAQDVNAPTPHLKALIGDYSRLYPDFRSVVVTDAKGFVRVGVPESFQRPGLNVADRSFFVEAMRRRSSVSDVIRARANNDPIVVVATPIFDNGSGRQVVGVAHGSLATSAIRYFVQAYVTDPQALVTVLDRNNRVIYASEALGYTLEHDMTNSALLRITDAAPLGSVYELPRIETGEEARLASRGIVNLTGWMVIVQQPLTVSTLQAPTYYAFTLAVVLLAIGGSLVGARLFARAITSPLEDLVGVVRRMSLNTGAAQATVVPGAPAEIVALVDDVNGMQGRLADSYATLQAALEERESLNRELTSLTQELEDKVEKRTAQLATTMSMMENIIAAMPGALLAVDAHGRISLCNDMAATLSGRKMERLKGMSLSDVLHGVDETPLRETGSGMRVIRAERTIVTESGEVVPVLVSSAEVPTMLSTSARTIHIAIDIRERKQLELELHHAQKLESVGRLAAGIAHEINTPTQFVSDSIHFLKDAILSFEGVVAAYRDLRSAVSAEGDSMAAAEAALVAEEEADLDYLLEHVPSAIDRSIEGLSRVTTIVRSMKEFAHPDQREMASADLNHAIENTLVIAKNEFKYVADVETDFGDLPRVVCHLGDINQVVLNVVVNAAHAIGDIVAGSDARGRIVLQTREEAGYAVIRISDTGGGIPEAIRGRIFDPFFTTKEVGRGTGQGLAIARSIVVDKHKGTFTFETEEGQGTTFVVRLPINPPEGSEGALAA